MLKYMDSAGGAVVALPFPSKALVHSSAVISLRQAELSQWWRGVIEVTMVPAAKQSARFDGAPQDLQEHRRAVCSYASEPQGSCTGCVELTDFIMQAINEFALDEIRVLQRAASAMDAAAAAQGPPEPAVHKHYGGAESGWVQVKRQSTRDGDGQGSAERSIYVSLETGARLLEPPPGGEVVDVVHWRRWMDKFSFGAEWAKCGGESGRGKNCSDDDDDGGGGDDAESATTADAPTTARDAGAGSSSDSGVDGSVGGDREVVCGFTFPHPRPELGTSEAFLKQTLRDFLDAIADFEASPPTAWRQSGDVRVCKRIAPFPGISILGQIEVNAPPCVVWALIRDPESRQTWDLNTGSVEVLKEAFDETELQAIETLEGYTPGGKLTRMTTKPKWPSSARGT